LESVKDHYDRFLGSVYSWILGDFDHAAKQNSALFDSLGLDPDPGAIAVDLGAGPGCQSVPLARLGYDVLALDFCQALLNELDGHAGDLPITTVREDITRFTDHLSGQADLIVCMGDTLVHLPDFASVDTVLDAVCQSLKPGGRFIYAIRDYFSMVPEGPDRFIPIRSSEDKVFTCFLDYREDTVHVHDLLHYRTDGEWQLEISDYLKLRLRHEAIDERLAAGGCPIGSSMQVDGMITGVARKTL
jgi:SAM-dependent methyltransferase